MWNNNASPGSTRSPTAVEDLLHAARFDHLAGGQVAHALELGYIDQQTAGHQLRQRVDAEPIGAMLFDDLVETPPVVHPIAYLQMVEGIHVGAHLLCGLDLLDDPVDIVLAPPVFAGADPAAVQLMGGGRQHLLERATRKGRDPVVDHVREVEHLSTAHQSRSAAPRPRRLLR